VTKSSMKKFELQNNEEFANANRYHTGNTDILNVSVKIKKIDCENICSTYLLFRTL
jgi:hypothetical protein